MSFTINDASIFDFGGRPPESTLSRQTLLWPAWAWRVLMPAPRTSGLNLFSATALRLCRAGLTRPAELADAMRLPRELVGRTLNGLVADDLLDADLQITKRGVDTLEDTATEAPLQLGFMFSDPLTGRLWPFFHEGALPATLLPLERENGPPRKRVTFNFGTQGKPRHKTTWWVQPPQKNLEPRMPSQRQVLRACQKAALRDQERGISLERGWAAVRDALVPVMSWATHPHLIKVVPQPPNPCLLVTRVYIPDDAARTHWQVCDPFREAADAELRERVEQRRGQNDKGARTLNECLESLTMHAFDRAPDQHRNAYAQGRHEALESLKARFGAAFSDFPDELRHKLCEVETLYAKVQKRGDAVGEDRLMHDRKVLCRAAYGCLEALLATHLSARPGSITWQHLGKNGQGNGNALVETLERRLRVPVTERDELIGFLNVKAGHVRNIVEFDGRNLRSQVATWILACARHPDDPLLKAVRRDGRLLNGLNALNNARNSAAHSDSRDIRDEEVEDFYQLVCAMVAATFRVDATPAKQPDASSMPGDRPNVEVGAVPMARDAIDSRFGTGLRLIPKLQKALYDAQLSANRLNGGRRARLDDLSLMTRNTLVALGQCAEATLAEVLTPAPGFEHMELGRGDRCETALYDALGASGFEFDDGTIPKTLLMSRRWLIERALTTPHKASLSALGAACLLCSAASEHHPARRAAQADARFLARVAALSDARGHGDRGDVSEEEMEALVEHCFAIVDTMLKITF